MQRIGPYVVEAELGRGGMGAVYAVRDPAGQRRALKVLSRGLFSDATDLGRFQREAQLLSRVQHPNVVRVLDGGEDAVGPYLVLDLVEGESLDRVVRRGPQDPLWAARLVRALADGVAAVHAQGILHRDLKPHNVVLRPDGVPVLLDFGLARGIGAEGLTQTGTVLGTPAYMSPEQAGGESTRTLDQRSDVYGLGTILFALVAGRPPFDGQSISTVSRVILKDPEWPDVAPDLLALLQRVLAKEREERPPSAAALRDELDEYLQAAAPAPAPASGRAPLLAVGALLLAGLAGLGVWAATGRGAGPATDAAGGAAEPAPVEPSDPGPAEPELAPGPSAEDLARCYELPHQGGLPDEVRACFVSDARALTWGRRSVPLAEGEVVLWDLSVRPPRPLRTWAVGGSVDALDLAGGQAWLAVASGDEARLVRIPDLEADGWEVVTTFPERVTALAAEGERVLLGTVLDPGDIRQPMTSTVRLLDPRGAELDALPIERAIVYDLLFLPDGRLAAGTGSDGRGAISGTNSGLILWRPERGQVEVSESIAPLRQLLLAPGGETLWIGFEDFRLTGHAVDQLSGGLTNSLVADLHGRGTVAMEEAGQGGEASLFARPAHQGRLTGLAWAGGEAGGLLLSACEPDGSSGGQRELRGWDPVAHEQRLVVLRWPQPPASLDASPDGSHLLLGFSGDARRAELWPLAKIPRGAEASYGDLPR